VKPSKALIWYLVDFAIIADIPRALLRLGDDCLIEGIAQSRLKLGIQARITHQRFGAMPANIKRRIESLARQQV